jgi:hypothetical protein
VARGSWLGARGSGGLVVRGAEIDPAPEAERATTGELLSRLERGELNVKDVLSQLKKSEGES